MNADKHIAEFHELVGDERMIVEWYESLSPEKQFEVQTFVVRMLNIQNNPSPVTHEEMTLTMMAAYIRFNHPEVCAV